MKADDVISRQAVLEIVEREQNKGDALSEIEKLPPVTPQYTDTEIQKMQDLESVEIQTAYEIGKLEQEPCKDTISREAVIDIIEDVCPIYGNDYRYILRDKVNELPPVNPAEKVGHWIPVSERYPEDGQRVLVDYCDEDAGIMLIRFNVNGYRGFKAWMPLPEPYKASPTGEEVEE